MKLLTAVLFLSLSLSLVASSYGSFNLIESYLSTPLLAWNSAPGSAKTSANALSPLDLQEQLLTLLGLTAASDAAADADLQTLGSNPEILVVFVEPSFSTQDFLIYSGAHAADGAASASLRRVRQYLETSSSIVLENVVLSHTHLAPVLSKVAAEQLRTHITSSLTIFCDSEPLLSLSSFSSQIRTHANSVPALRAFFSSEQATAMGTNGVTDLIFVFFETLPGVSDLQTGLARDDELVGEFISTISQITPDYIAMLASETAPAVEFFDFHRLVEVFESQKGVVANQTMFPTYWPPNVVEGLLTAGVLLIVAFVGICCTCYTQTPDRFPEPPREGQPNHNILYPNKQ
jgi:hypothetical protein